MYSFGIKIESHLYDSKNSTDLLSRGFDAFNVTSNQNAVLNKQKNKKVPIPKHKKLLTVF